MREISTILLSACVGALLTMMLTRSCRQELQPEVQIMRDTTTIVQIDTHYFPKPEPYKVEVRDTVYIPNPQYPQYPQYPQVLVQEVKEYRDSSYYARISGINAFLEHIEVYPKQTTKYITSTEIIRERPSKWAIGLQGGYGITPKGLQPYIGVGVTYKFAF